MSRKTFNGVDCPFGCPIRQHIAMVFGLAQRLKKPPLDQVVQKNDNGNHWINHYSANRVVCFLKTNPLESDVSVDGVVKALNNREQAYNNFVKERLKLYLALSQG